MLFTFLAITFLAVVGVSLSQWELNRTKQQRREMIRARARRCVGGRSV